MTLHALILGLGLFFLGMQLTGDGLRRLAAGGFRHLFEHWTSNALSRMLVGLSAGALMQSATAVTFILASMRKAGLTTYHSALPVIMWCNVGLTALAFVATLPIHPVVSFMVGAAGVAAGLIKTGRRRMVVMTILGLCLILYGLQTIGAGAKPLGGEVWFKEFIERMTSSPPLAFLAGIAAAAIVQSNTGASMIVIALANAGIMLGDSAAMLIYGTNLGAIFLRMFLAMGLDRTSLRLVRFEDVFVIWGGLLMSTLFFLETVVGVPLVLAFSRTVCAERDLQLTVVFLLSNALPALAMAPVVGRVGAWLEKLMPDRPEDDPSKLQYLNKRVLQDPATAPDVIAMENARLLGMIRQARSLGESDEGSQDFLRLVESIDAFIGKLSAGKYISPAEAERIHLARVELTLIKFVEESVCGFRSSLCALEVGKETEAARSLDSLLSNFLERTEEAGKSLNPALIDTLVLATSKSGLAVQAAQDAGSTSCAAGVGLAANKFIDCMMMLHKLAKNLRKQAVAHGRGGDVGAASLTPS